MVGYEDVKRYVAKTGFQTKEDIQKCFHDVNREILEAYLKILVEKNQLRKVQYNASGHVSELYYIPPGA
jgi:hypothetical protein